MFRCHIECPACSKQRNDGCIEMCSNYNQGASPIGQAFTQFYIKLVIQSIWPSPKNSYIWYN